MPNYTPNQIAQLAYQAGFRGADLKTAVAVALAESSGNPLSYNPEKAAGTRPGGGSYGLWQVYLTAHPEFRGVNLYDPLVNAKAAYSVYRAAGNRFTPWSTYNQGQAARVANTLNINQGQLAQTGQPLQTTQYNAPPPTIATSGGVQAQPSPLVSVNLLPQNVTGFLASPDFPITIVSIALGGLLVIFGLLMLFAPVLADTAKAAIKVAPAALV